MPGSVLVGPRRVLADATLEDVIVLKSIVNRDKDARDLVIHASLMPA
jgi:hypothetical protein